MRRGFQLSVGSLFLATFLAMSGNARGASIESNFKKWIRTGQDGLEKCVKDLVVCYRALGNSRANDIQKRYDAIMREADNVRKKMKGDAVFGKSDEKRRNEFHKNHLKTFPNECKAELPKCLDDKRKTEATNRALQQGKTTEDKAKHVEDLAKGGGAVSVGAPSGTRSLRSGIRLWRRVRTGAFVRGFDVSRVKSVMTSAASTSTAEIPRAATAAQNPAATSSSTAPTAEPRVYITLPSDAPLKLTNPPSSDAETAVQMILKSKELRDERLRAIASRDREELDIERMMGLGPTQFCTSAGRCFSKLNEIANTLYGSATSGLSVFCAPRKTGAATQAGGGWDASKVHCSTNWVDTLGGWQPWTPSSAEGDRGRLVASKAPEPGVIPPYACFGNANMNAFATLPQGGEAGWSGFKCRKRVFRILATDAAMNQADENKAIVNMCTEMRQQVWAEKYANINAEYQKWCRTDPARVKKNLCLPPPKTEDGDEATAKQEPLPFMLLTREEMLYFYGHREVFCRGDRSGLTHFLYNDKWADTFTCGIARGLLEAGPFEEGVQACAISPYVGEPGKRGSLTRDDAKARLHCWKFTRPTCEEVSISKSKQEELDSLHRSNVFDAYDAFREYRRTQNKDVLELLDMKDAEKVRDFTDQISYSDSEKDEGTLDVKDFCRFVGDTSKIQCGYGKASMAAWYEARKDEAPAACDSGVCARGAYKRGYMCGVFSSEKYFEGKPQWVCGVDVGPAGQRLIAGASAVCVGGARAREFQSARGDTGSLQCYERRFKWAESQGSATIAGRLVALWPDAIRGAADEVAKDSATFFDPWLAGGKQSLDLRDKLLEEKAKAAANKDANGVSNANNKLGVLVGWWETALKKFGDTWKADTNDIVKWASDTGNTLGHRASAWKLLMSSNLKAINDFKNLSTPIGTAGLVGSKYEYAPLGSRTGQGISLVTQSDSDDPKERKDFKVVTKDGVQQLKDLVDEVVNGNRPADDKWYAEFRSAATEDAMLRLTPESFSTALRAHHLFEVVEKARRVVLREAKAYHQAVLRAARERKPMTRLEMHEMARTTALPAGLAGSVFCVAAKDRYTSTGRTEYVCASSPLLMAGAVESFATAPLAGGPSPTAEAEVQKLRLQAKTDWCYGSAQGMGVYGAYSKQTLVEGAGLASPFEMAPPESVCTERKKGASGQENACAPKAKSAANWLKCAGFQYSDLDWSTTVGSARSLQMASQDASGVSREEQIRLEDASRKAKAEAEKAQQDVEGVKGAIAAEKAKLSKLKGVSVAVVAGKVASLQGQLSGLERKAKDLLDKANRAAQALLATGKRIIGAAKAGVDKVSAVGDKVVAGVSGAKETAEKGKEILQKVSGIIAPLLDLVSPKLAKAVKSIENVAHTSLEFIREWAGKIEDIIRPVWEKVKQWGNDAVKAAEDALALAEKTLNEAKEKAYTLYKEAREGAEKLVTDARDKVEKALVKEAGAAAQMKEAAAREAADLKQKLQDAKKAASELIKGKEKEGKALADGAKKVFEGKQGDLKKLVVGLAKMLAEKATEWIATEAQKKIGGFMDKILDDLMNLVSSRVMELLEPGVRNLLAQGFKFVRSVLGPIAKAIIGALASVPFVGGALAPVGQVLYDFGMNKLEDLAFDLLRGVVERFFGKTVRGFLAKVFKAFEKQLKSFIAAGCSKLGFGDVCKPLMKIQMFAMLPERHQWLARAINCKERPLIDEAMHKKAYAARQKILRIGNEMRRDVELYARAIADRQLAKFGLSYDGLMAMKRGPAPIDVLAAADAANAAIARNVAKARNTVDARRPKMRN
ncbi:MAG: hypothetical protein HYY84_20030 [Deltaproteobacteria bacterium]|nr:hypothetical protein [Deltaproteobacteria bacterium]